jgi:DNA-binding response OmpR family regulator
VDNADIEDPEERRCIVTKLLIVDDEPFTVDMLQTFLEINGFHAVGAFNGEDGLVLIKVEEPEIVILDLMLPDIEGYEVCQRIRGYPDTKNLPVLILSARADAASKERAMAAGADGYLVKPVKFPELLTELNRLVEKIKEAKEAATTPVQPLPMSTPPTPSPLNAETGSVVDSSIVAPKDGSTTPPGNVDVKEPDISREVPPPTGGSPL